MFESSIEPGLLPVLDKLQSSGIFQKYSFYLAGDTGLALQIGHRLSVDMKGLGYFEDAENEPVPIMQQSNQQVPLIAEEWENIKQFMLNTQKTAIKDLTQ